MNKKSVTALNILTLSLSTANLAIGLVLDRKRKDLERREGQVRVQKEKTAQEHHAIMRKQRELFQERRKLQEKAKKGNDVDAAVLRALAGEKDLQGVDLRAAMLLIGRSCRPGDLVDNSANRSKYAVSHAIRHLKDGGWLDVHEVDGIRYYSLIGDLASRHPQSHENKEEEG